jgi:DNA-binding transcriptional LysR family regulator
MHNADWSGVVCRYFRIMVVQFLHHPVGTFMKHLKLYTAIRLIRRQGSIRKAAELLAVSPSALNRSIQNFEEAIGVEVFERIPAGVRLTPAGELLVDVVERHLVEFEELQRQVSNLREGHAGVLRIGVGADIGAGLALAAIGDLEEDMPGVSTEILGGDPVRLLEGREIDLAIVTAPETTPALEVLAGQSVPLTAVATSAWDAPDGAPALWHLARGRLVLPPEGTGARTAIDHLFRRHAIAGAAVSSVAAGQLGAAMARGARVAIFPDPALDGALPKGLRRLALPLGTVQIGVLRRTGIPLSRPMQRLLGHLTRRLDDAA